MENSFNDIVDAINGLGKTSGLEIFSTIVSCLSLVFAILVPVRIASKQNKISLFTKRYNSYNELKRIVVFSKVLQMYKENRSINDRYKTSLKHDFIVYNVEECYEQHLLCNHRNDINAIIIALEKSESIILSIPILYNFNEKSKESFFADIDDLFKAFKSFLQQVYKNEEPFDETMNTFIEKSIQIGEKYLNKLERKLKI